MDALQSTLRYVTYACFMASIDTIAAYKIVHIAVDH